MGTARTSGLGSGELSGVHLGRPADLSRSSKELELDPELDEHSIYELPVSEHARSLADSSAADARQWLNVPGGCGFAIVRGQKLRLARRWPGTPPACQLRRRADLRILLDTCPDLHAHLPAAAGHYRPFPSVPGPDGPKRLSGR